MSEDSNLDSPLDALAALFSDAGHDGSLIIQLLQDDNFDEIERLVDSKDPSLSFTPLFTSIYSTINAKNANLKNVINFDRNTILFVKLYVWLINNKREDIINIIKDQLQAQTQHEWQLHNFCRDSLDLCGAMVRGFLFNTKFSSSKLLTRLEGIERHPHLQKSLLAAQLLLDKHVNIVLQGTLWSQPLSYIGKRDERQYNWHTHIVLACNREKHLQAILDALPDENKKRIEDVARKGTRWLALNDSDLMYMGLAFGTAFLGLRHLIVNPNNQEGYPSDDRLSCFILEFVALFCYLMSITAIVPISALIARVASLGTLEIGGTVTEVTLRAAVNSILVEYADGVAKKKGPFLGCLFDRYKEEANDLIEADVENLLANDSLDNPDYNYMRLNA